MAEPGDYPEADMGAPTSGDDTHPYYEWASKQFADPSAAPPAEPASAAESTPSGPITSPEHLGAPLPVFVPPDAAAFAQVPGAAPTSTQPEGPVVSPSGAPAPVAADDAVARERAIQGLVGGDHAAIAQLKPDEVQSAVQGMTPDEFVRFKSLRDRQMVMRQAELEHNAAADSEMRAREDMQMQRDAVAKANTDTAAVLVDAQKLAASKEDPDRFVKHLGVGGSIAMLFATTLGGAVSQYTGGRNLALESFNRRIEQDIEAQRSDRQNAWRGIEARRGAVGDTFNRQQDLYRAQETYRVAAYNAAIGKIQGELQQYDPAGGTASYLRTQLDQFHGAQAAALQAYNDHQLKNHLDVMKEDRDQRLATSTISKNAAETAEAYARANKTNAEAGTLRPQVSENYAIPSGFFNPFNPQQQIMGKRTLGGKGEDPKERNTVSAQMSTYGHVQDYWNKLREIGDRIGYAKSLGESAWKARRGTLESEYDSAKEALTVYLTKELGDKLTQGQLDGQAHRIPDRASVFDARDPKAQIESAMGDADRDFARDMNQVGIDASPVIRAAQEQRAAVAPSAQQAADAANAVLATNPNDKDAKRALEEANERLSTEADRADLGKQAITAVSHLPPDAYSAQSIRIPDDASPQERTLAKGANREWMHYDAQRQDLDAKTREYNDGGAPGQSQQRKLGELAIEVKETYERAVALTKEARTAVDNGKIVRQAAAVGIDADEALARVRVGINPVTGGPMHEPPPPAVPAPAPVPYNPIAPDRSFAPGADPFATPVSHAPPKPKPNGHR